MIAYEIKFWICGNDETICDGRDVGCWEKEASRDAVDDAVAALWRVPTPAGVSADYEVEHNFAAWHGGRRSRPQNNVVIERIETTDADNGGDDETSEWISIADAPSEVRAYIEAAENAMGEAAGAALDRWEKMHSETLVDA